MRTLKKELRDAQEALQLQSSEADEVTSCRPSSYAQLTWSIQVAAKWKRSFEAERVKTAKLTKDLEGANAMLAGLRAELEAGAKDKDRYDTSAITQGVWAQY